MQDLGTLPGGSSSNALGVSGDGLTVVGYDGPVAKGAFLWTLSLGMVDLNTYLPTLGVDLTGWHLNQSTGVSADGTAIVGYGTISGEMRAWRVAGLPGATVTCYANCDHSTTAPCLNVLDFSCFLNAFAAGCSTC